MDIPVELIRQAQRELPYATTAFADICERIYPTVRAMSMGVVRNPTDAEQVTQDALLRVMHGLGKLDDPARFYGWLNRIVLNVAYSYIAKEQRERGKSSMPEDELVVEDGGDAPAFEALVAHLSRDERTLLALRFVNELEFQEIAEVMGLGLSAAKMRFYRALDKVKQQLGVDRE